METLVDVVGLALVAKVTLAIVVQEILVEGFGEIGSLLNAGLLQGDVYLSVRTDSSAVALHLVTRMDVLEDLKSDTTFDFDFDLDKMLLTVHNPEDDLDGFIRRHPSPQKCK